MLPLIYSGISYSEREKRARKALRQAGLEEERFYHHRSNQLSGGQVQRVAIARALVNKPAIILADEPTGNLDTKNSHLVMGAFQELNKKGNTIIVITHEDEVADFAKRVISIRDGVIEKDRKNKEQTTYDRRQDLKNK